MAPGSVYSHRHTVGVSHMLPRDVDPSAGNVAVRKRARVIPASPRQSPSCRPYYSRRFGLGIAYEWHQGAIWAEAHQHMDVIGDDRLREHVQ